ncbi:unnamed protein product [Brucella canis str. Oliveri]|uniref:Uncharacterized protein n=1 Tax=Brucella canis (strain ATCC 23365 / NCTC 10854 / RM-666) TaxID=483179 RepID=A9M6P6_BRUC2|nr:Hypothetical protein, conserved [Brucella canis ATCC 23365]CDL75466.1 unnamed protein product [Brucella canis str. Oliveri]
MFESRLTHILAGGFLDSKICSMPEPRDANVGIRHPSQSRFFPGLPLQKGGGGRIEPPRLGALHIVFWCVQPDFGLTYRPPNASHAVFLDLETGDTLQKDRFD